MECLYDRKMERESITLDDIEAMEDFCECFEAADLLGISLDGLDTVDDMKERLTMEVLRCQPNFINCKEKTCKEMQDMTRHDEKKRKAVLELVDKAQSKLICKTDTNTSKKLSIIHEALRTENTVTNLDDELNQRKKWLKSNQCCFVIAGETSAGKSYFLNLLLGEEVLPSHLLPCTSVITRISYSTTRHAKIIYHDEGRRPLTFDDVTTEQIKTFIFEEDILKRDTTSDIKEVQIFLPSKILQNGLVLIDSPGIGENDGMDTVIETFVDTNQVMGFIYIIKSDNGGGIDEDRLVKLMKIILEKEKHKEKVSAYRFDPSCAMFVCNIWDRVTEPDKVYNHIVHRLGKIWPQFDKDRLVTFSSLHAMRETDVNPDYIVKDYRRILAVLCEMTNMALDSQIKKSYNWISTILTRSAHHVTTMVRKLTNDKGKLNRTLKEANDNLDTIHNQSTIVITALRQLISNKTDEICAEFREYLSKPAVNLAIKQWILQEVPSEKDKDGEPRDWEDIKQELDGLIYDRISDELNKWEEGEGRIRELEDFVMYEINIKLGCLAKEIETVETNMTKPRRHSIVPAPPQHRDSFCVGQSSKGNLDKWVRISVVATNKIAKPFHKFRKLLPGRNRIRQYCDNKVAYATGRSQKLLRQFLEQSTEGEDQLRDAIKTFMEGPKEILDSLILKIPKSIDANKKILGHIASFQLDAISTRRVYEEIMNDLEELKRLLGYYGAGYIFIDDFKQNELHIIDPTDNTGRTSAPFKITDFLNNLSTSQTSVAQSCPRGMWTAHQKGRLERVGNDVDVSIKVYLQSCKMNKHIKEIAKLRLLEKHKNIACFLGIQNSESYYPALVYKHHLTPLRQYLLKRSGKMDKAFLLGQCCSGLEFLHGNGLVHMELNMNTIMVNREGTVTLTGGCLPRVADLPDDPEQHIISDFVYLAPEVLRGELYTASADVYAFGLLLFDLISGSPAFSKQRQMSLDIFIQKIISEEGMRLDTDSLNFADTGKRLIGSCVELLEDSRPSISGIQDEIQVMVRDECFDNLGNSENHTVLYERRVDCGRF